MAGSPTAEQAAAALSDAEASRAGLARRIAAPSWFFTSMAVAVAVQIATTALGVGDRTWGGWSLSPGWCVFAAVAGVQNGALPAAQRRLARRIREPGGARAPEPRASLSYAAALGIAIWSALDGQWALMVLSAIAGGGAYALSGRRWLRTYRREPALHGRGESAVIPGGRRARGDRRAGAAHARALMDDLDANILAPARLKLMTMLTAVSEAEFSTLRESLEVSDSVLSKHVSALAAVDYVRSRKGVHLGRRTTWIALTRTAGRRSARTSRSCGSDRRRRLTAPQQQAAGSESPSARAARPT